MENLLVPFQATTHIPCTGALVLAPHPDDEVFGCGGAIMRHVEQGTPVYVIVVTDGAYGTSNEQAIDYARQRQNESITAANMLGYGSPIFWSYGDRKVCYGEKLVQEIMAAIEKMPVDLIYAPSVSEMHPDHRAIGMATIEAVRRIGKSMSLALYEIGVPLHPNQLLDISDLAERKQKAMACFISQIEKQRYDLDIAALNRYRTYTLPANVTAAEAYLLVSAAALGNDPLKLYQSEHTRQKTLGLVLDSRDLPLVSVIIRSMDRVTLSDALDSVALQTYSNIEVIIVNAKGTDHSDTGQWCGRFPIRMEENGKSLARSLAANTGLEVAKGEYLIFLDDDDLFYPAHVNDLVAALQNQNNARCAYAGICVDHYVDGKLKTSSEFNEPYDRRRLWGRNFIPIHAMLFERSLVTDGCRFDENMEYFEDWDFWIQLSQRTKILHINKINALYRNFGHSGLGFEQDKSLVRKLRGEFYDKWKVRLTGEQLNEFIEYKEELTTELINQTNDLHTQSDGLRHQLANSQQLATSLQDQLDRLAQDSLTSASREASLHQTITDMVNSKSWGITKPLRFFVRIFRGQHH